MVRDGTAALGHRGIEEVSPDCGRSLDPEISMRSGVINEPPPTPVSPTRRPTTKPERTKRGLIVNSIFAR
jgi:hypothetical protein